MISTNLYAISDEAGNVKFGLAQDPAKRLSDLQTGNANKLVLLDACQIPDAKEARNHEWNVHFCLEKLGLRKSGEWFAPSIFTTIAVGALALGSIESFNDRVTIMYHEFSKSLEKMRAYMHAVDGPGEMCGLKPNGRNGWSDTPARLPNWAYAVKRAKKA
ncbi:GIY-YIG nuclease family protein [Sphingomonas sp.]|uniref:GIY-YIG nuclease family protein n=1 Tax=Sphingomonas sp. TaxID=28214 RepID=UPI003568EEEF